jgi:hypothetical protein
MDHEEMQTLRAADSTRCGGTPTGLSVEGFEGAIRDGTLDMAMISLPVLHAPLSQ